MKCLFKINLLYITSYLCRCICMQSLSTSYLCCYRLISGNLYVKVRPAVLSIVIVLHCNHLLFLFFLRVSMGKKDHVRAPKHFFYSLGLWHIDIENDKWKLNTFGTILRKLGHEKVTLSLYHSSDSCVISSV